MSEWIGGRRPVAEALAAGREAHRLILSASARPAPELRAITDAARRMRLPIDRVPADRMTRIAGFDGHQGVLLEVGERRWAEVAEMLASARASESSIGAGRSEMRGGCDGVGGPVGAGTAPRASHDT